MTHRNVTHWDDVEAEEVDVGDLRGRWRDLGSAAGSFRAGVQPIDLAPGGRSAPCGVGVVGRLEPCYWDGED